VLHRKEVKGLTLSGALCQSRRCPVILMRYRAK
jgi:hypothetical protein